jgi:hypothetical protein
MDLPNLNPNSSSDCDTDRDSASADPVGPTSVCDQSCDTSESLSVPPVSEGNSENIFCDISNPSCSAFPLLKPFVEVIPGPSSSGDHSPPPVQDAVAEDLLRGLSADDFECSQDGEMADPVPLAGEVEVVVPLEGVQVAEGDPVPRVTVFGGGSVCDRLLAESASFITSLRRSNAVNIRLLSELFTELENLKVHLAETKSKDASRYGQFYLGTLIAECERLQKIVSSDKAAFQQGGWFAVSPNFMQRVKKVKADYRSLVEKLKVI